jgi:membrane protein YdbS with pleckstrin-like domain
MNAEPNERLAWLERKMVQVLYLLINAGSWLLSWQAANLIMGEKSGWSSWSWGIVFVVTFFLVFFILQRYVFKGAPKHVDLIDP